MPADRLRKLPAPPPPLPFSWSEARRSTAECTADYLLMGLYACLIVVALSVFLGLGLPKLLVAAHAAWTEALTVWGVIP